MWNIRFFCLDVKRFFFVQVVFADTRLLFCQNQTIFFLHNIMFFVQQQTLVLDVIQNVILW